MNNILNKTQIRLFLGFARYLLPYWKKELFIIILSGITVLLGMVNPYLTKLVIDRAFGNKDIKTFILLALVGGGVFILDGLLSGLKNFLDRQIGIKVSLDLNRKIFSHLEKLPFSYFQNKSTGEHIFKINYDISTTGNFISTILPEIITLLPKLLFILAVVFYLNWKMALFSLMLAPFLYLPPYYFTRKMRKATQDLIGNNEGVFRRLSEMFSHIQLVKIFGREKFEVRDFIKRLIFGVRTEIRNTKLELISGFAGSALNRVIIGLISFYGGYQVIKGEMTLGSLTAIMVYLSQLIGLQGSFAWFFQKVALGFISCERIKDILDIDVRGMDSESAKEAKFNQGRVEFKNVSFSYRENKAVLDRVSFVIEGGGYIAFAGPSGCGKTTILNLILKLYDFYCGEITVDGFNIKEIKLKPLLDQIGMVLQEPFLWNDTIENNIRYGKLNAEEAEITEAARICGVDDFVKQLPDKYKTIIGENACKLSEGQKQKIAIARALIKKPKILILDEAMASMDSESEERIIANLRQIPEISTVIFVSHRLSTVKMADKVYYLRNPKEIIVSSPEELLKENQQFRVLFAAQTG